MSQISDLRVLSPRGYAKHRACNHMSVMRAIRMGRLSELAVKREGRNYFIDPVQADKDWAANTDYSEAPKSVINRFAPVTVQKQAEEQAPEDDGLGNDGLPQLSAAMSLTDANRVGAYWKAKHSELKFKEEAGELVSKDEVEQEWGDLLASVRTKLLGIPTRFKQKIPELTAKQGLAIEELIREALEGLAGGEE